MARFSVLASLAVAVLLAACGGQGSPPVAAHELRGVLNLGDYGVAGAVINLSGACVGDSGYEDIHSGTSVVVRNETGSVLATGSLGVADKTPPGCHFPFDIPSIADAKFYQVEVSHRGSIAYSRADLDAASWKVVLALGG